MRPPSRDLDALADLLRARLDEHRVDLSALVSKYIGETEHSLDEVFSRAESADAILFFDEAEALFGKRSDIKDAHARYQDLEGSPLVARLKALFAAGDKWPP